ncbi:MAG: hypothetical protein KIT27_04350 [Legionellales bacterium]|nr:hypothetical protein [Legionellales bacterium]
MLMRSIVLIVILGIPSTMIAATPTDNSSNTNHQQSPSAQQTKAPGDNQHFISLKQQDLKQTMPNYFDDCSKVDCE